MRGGHRSRRETQEPSGDGSVGTARNTRHHPWSCTHDHGGEGVNHAPGAGNSSPNALTTLAPAHHYSTTHQRCSCTPRVILITTLSGLCTSTTAIQSRSNFELCTLLTQPPQHSSRCILIPAIPQTSPLASTFLHNYVGAFSPSFSTRSLMSAGAADRFCVLLLQLPLLEWLPLVDPASSRLRCDDNACGVSVG